MGKVMVDSDPITFGDLRGLLAEFSDELEQLTRSIPEWDNCVTQEFVNDTVADLERKLDALVDTVDSRLADIADNLTTIAERIDSLFLDRL